MEKTLLESNLEQTLLELKMPLGERIYAEDLDFEAEIEDSVSTFKSDKPSKETFVKALLLGESPTLAQLHREFQPFLTRLSDLCKGLGFSYVIDSSKHKAGEKKPAAKIADEIISKRDFGDSGVEVLKIWYSQDFARQLEIVKPRYKPQLINKFYGDYASDNERFSVGVGIDYKIYLDNYYKQENHEFIVISGILEEIETSFNGKYLNQENTKLLTNYIRKLKDGV